MKRKRGKGIFALMLFLLGLAIFCYPMMRNFYYKKSVEQNIQEYKETINNYDSVSVVNYDDLIAMAEAIGYLEIPKLEIQLPIYYGDDEEVLQKGIGHVPGSSPPLGGESTHCVLSGHSGLAEARILTDLHEMEIDDFFYLHVQNEELIYRVDNISVVLPEELDEIQIVRGKDYVTLVTCTPYGLNTHRLLVRGERVPAEEENSLEVVTQE